jgi:hypothetical protein
LKKPDRLLKLRGDHQLLDELGRQFEL